jgi:hypothetical protein
MSWLRIEMDCGNGWEVRSEGDVQATSIDEIAGRLRIYAIQYAHRAFLNGVLVAGYDPVHRRTVEQKSRPH